MLEKENIFKEISLFLKNFFNDLFYDKLGFYAASMSWSSIFFIIPFLVILLVAFTYMPIFDTAYLKIHNLLSESLVTSNRDLIIGHIDKFVDNAGKLGVIGFIYVVIATVMFFKDYDFIVNDIFNTPQRGILEAIKTYFGLILLLPFTLGSSFWVFDKLDNYLSSFSIYSILHLKLIIPYLIIWLMFYIAYQLSPRVSVNHQAAFISSFIASLIWFIAKSLFVYYIIYNKTYTSIYGGLSTVLFLFLWIYISWAIFLHGLRFCYILDKKSDNR